MEKAQQTNPYPLFERISIECNSFCNRSCTFCTRSIDNREKKRMPEELIHKVLNELAEINYKGLIAFHFYNEIFTDKRIFSFFEKCQQLGLSNYVITNGDFLSRENVKALSKYNIKEFTLSIYDWSTEDDFASKCKELNDNLRLEEYPWDYHIIKGGDNFGNRAGYVNHKTENLTLPVKAACSKIETKIDVRYDGAVVMCCMDYYGIHKIGDISKDNIVDIWYGEIRQQQMRDLKLGLRERYKLCSKCSDYIKPVG